jgi:hypothetical protein
MRFAAGKAIANEVITDPVLRAALAKLVSCLSRPVYGSPPVGSIGDFRPCLDGGLRRDR